MINIHWNIIAYIIILLIIIYFWIRCVRNENDPTLAGIAGILFIFIILLFTVIWGGIFWNL